MLFKANGENTRRVVNRVRRERVALNTFVVARTTTSAARRNNGGRPL